MRNLGHFLPKDRNFSPRIPSPEVNVKPNIPSIPVVIVAEDELPVRMLAVEFLMDEGFAVIEAENAEEVLIVLESRARAIHVLFSDIHMSGHMNGVELAHHVKDHWPWIGVLLASGQAAPGSLDLPIGCRFLAKPYDPVHVVAHCRELISGSA